MSKTKTKRAVESMNGNGTPNPFEKCIPVACTVHLPTDSRQVDKADVKVDADPDMVNSQKKIYKCPEYARIVRLGTEIQDYLKRKQVPGGRRLFRRGTYPIPLTSLEDVDDRLEQYVQEFNQAVDEFIKVYDQRRDEALVRLRALGDPKDYDKAERVRNKFGIDYDYLSFGPPSALGVLNKDLYQRERQKIARASEDAILEVKGAMRVMFQKLLAHMVDRLTPDEKGKRKIFKDTLTTNMEEFLSDFRDRNITDDAELAAVVEKCRDILKGKDADTFRTDEVTRNEVAKVLEVMKKDVDQMVADLPVRSIMLDD